MHVVFDNQMLDFVDIEQREAGLRPFGTDLPNPDFATIAQAFGATGIRIEHARDLRRGVQDALHASAVPGEAPGPGCPAPSGPGCSAPRGPGRPAPPARLSGAG